MHATFCGAASFSGCLRRCDPRSSSCRRGSWPRGDVGRRVRVEVLADGAPAEGVAAGGGNARVLPKCGTVPTCSAESSMLAAHRPVALPSTRGRADLLGRVVHARSGRRARTDGAEEGVDGRRLVGRRREERPRRPSRHGPSTSGPRDRKPPPCSCRIPTHSAQRQTRADPEAVRGPVATRYRPLLLPSSRHADCRRWFQPRSRAPSRRTRSRP
jgi:hypothetical protein